MGEKIKLIVKNKNKTADIEKCFARLEVFGIIFEHGKKYPSDIFPFLTEYYQKNILWNRQSINNDGAITIAAEGSEILNIAEVVEDGFYLWFENKEKFHQQFALFSQPYYDFFVIFKLFGELNGNKIKHFRELYKIRVEMPQEFQPIQGKEWVAEEIANIQSKQKGQFQVAISKWVSDLNSDNQEIMVKIKTINS